MTNFQEITNRLGKAGLTIASGDSDETTIIVWGSNKEEIKNTLQGLHFQLLGYGYDNGILIAPKEDK